MAENTDSRTNGENDMKLSEIFDKIWKTWEELESSDEATNSDTFQARVAEGITMTTEAIRRVNTLRLFSDNEVLEEVASNEIRYMLLSALLGYFQVKVTTQSRLDSITKAEAFFVDYLRLCKNYEVTDITIPELSGEQESDEHAITPIARRPGPPNLVSMNAKRQQKIERYKQQKELDRQITEMKGHVDKEHVDDEVKRKYYTTVVKKWVNVTVEELESVQEEIALLQGMAKRSLEPQRPPETKPQTKPFRPFILTKSDLQKGVFGAGYPSLPTYTVEEWFDQQVALGNVPQPDSAARSLQSGPEAESIALEAEAEQKEVNVETDDADTLAKARSWDEWRDDHRAGWGNTHNKG